MMMMRRRRKRKEKNDNNTRNKVKTRDLKEWHLQSGLEWQYYDT